MSDAVYPDTEHPLASELSDIRDALQAVAQEMRTANLIAAMSLPPEMCMGTEGQSMAARAVWHRTIGELIREGGKKR